MANILINKITGSMAEIVKELGTKGKELPANSKCTIQQIDGELLEQYKFGHCKVVDDAIVVIPEEEWAENIDFEKLAEFANNTLAEARGE